MTERSLKNIKHVYLLGAGGIGMSALGRYFLARGCKVSGYDRTPGITTDALIRLGAALHFEDDPALIDPDFLSASPGHRLLIYTPAIPADSKVMTFFKAQGILPVKRSEVLGLITENSFNIAVAGTHGKTTTTALLSYILREAGRQPTAFIGGIIARLETNFIDGDGRITVIEADEYDRSFLRLKPSVAIVTSAEPDHLDIYETGEGVRAAFLAFIENIAPGGTLIIEDKAFKELDLNRIILPNNVKILVYGFQSGSAFKAVPKGRHAFVLEGNRHDLPAELPLPMPGVHNALNATAAALACLEAGLAMEHVAAGLYSFPGLHRRMEKIAANAFLAYYDDYAHHPTEIEVCVQALRDLAEGEPVTGIFQPHLYSRTRDFAQGFAMALDKLDTAVLMPIYPAREKPIAGVSTELIASLMKNPSRHQASHEEVIPLLEKLKPRGILATIGAGDIDRLVPEISQWLKTRNL